MGTSCSSFKKEHKKSIDSGASIEEKQSARRLSDRTSNITKSAATPNETTHLIAPQPNDTQEYQPKKASSQPASELRPPSQSANINYENHLYAPSVTPSPLPSSHTPSPYTTPSANKQLSLTPSGLPNLGIFSTDIRSLLIGQKLPPTSPLIHLPYNRELNIFLVGNDVGKHRELINTVSQGLRLSLATHKFSINFSNFALDSLYLYDESHCFSEICVESLSHVYSHGILIPLIILNGKGDKKLLPRTIDEAKYDQIISSSADQTRQFFQKWYYKDSSYKPPVYVLHRLSKHFTCFKNNSCESKQKAFEKWYQESREPVNFLLQHDSYKDLVSSILDIQLSFIAKYLGTLDKRILFIKTGSTSSLSPTTESALVQIQEKVSSGHMLIHTNSDSPDHTSWDDEILNFISETLKKMIEAILEEESSIQSFKFLSGIGYSLSTELIVQDACRKNLEKNFCRRENLTAIINSYLNSKTKRPLIIYGQSGSGKSSILAQCSTCASSLSPNSVVVFRFGGISDQSMTFNQLFRSVCEQLCLLYGEHQSLASSVAVDFEGTLTKLLNKANEERSATLLIDCADILSETEWKTLLKWLNKDLPNFTKVVITVSSGDQLEACKQFTNGFEFIDCNPISNEDIENIFNFILLTNSRQLSDAERGLLMSSLKDSQSLLFTHLIASRVISTNRSIEIEELSRLKSVDDIILQHLNNIGDIIEPPLLAAIVTLLSCMKYGLTEHEITTILIRLQPLQDMIYPCSTTFPCTLWSFIRHELRHLTNYVYANGFNMMRLSTAPISNIASKFSQKWKDIVKLTQEELLVLFNIAQSDLSKISLGCDAFYNEWPNRRKAQEYPYLLMSIGKNIKGFAKQYCLNKEWICLKLYFTDPFSLLEDIALLKTTFDKSKGIEESSSRDVEVLMPDINLLSSTITSSSYPLRYHGLQVFSQVYSRLESYFADEKNGFAIGYPEMAKLVKESKKPIVPSLIPLNTQFMAISKKVFELDKDLSEKVVVKGPTEELFQYDLIYPIRGNDSHVIALSTSRGEISVWNIVKEKSVRSLRGINQPKDLRMIDMYRGVVLCNRDLKIYNLDQGVLENKLKGVMNQKMPFFGLHDENYLVALSRNRMYVNMQSLKTGDLETTFKVGEDRFLNSLLVSANGNICVCGDETQKPFPLLVWDLTNRKLIYDLRIPQHEFITRLSAISDDGHYVACVSKELNSLSPNFIIVYDLQSGTLFKKWKPDCDTVSITISSQGSCVINGLESALILVWDLSTGAKRLTLQGHSNPVDILQVDEKGSTLLSYDSTGKDISIRIWDLENGHCLATFTPDLPLSCCRLTPNGKMVIICHVDSSRLHTLVLRSNKDDKDIVESMSSITFGDASREGLQFDLSKDS